MYIYTHHWVCTCTCICSCDTDVSVHVHEILMSVYDYIHLMLKCVYNLCMCNTNR